jgi:hypothetical protein
VHSSGFATIYALTTAIGLRPFVTLAFVSLAMRFGYLHAAAPFAFLDTSGATWVFSALALVELAADKIPSIDRAFAGMQFALKRAAAATVVASAVPPGSPPAGLAEYGFMALGALNALGVHAGITVARGASTAMTRGAANPYLSLVEDALAVGGALSAIVWPFAGAVLAFVLTLLIALLARYVFLAARSGRAAGFRSLAGRSRGGGRNPNRDSYE